MQKNQKVTLRIGEIKIFEDWVSTRGLGDELSLRYQLKRALKRVISDKEK